MRIVIYLVPGPDYHPSLKGNSDLQKELEMVTRNRLHLRDHDELEICGIMD